MSYPPLHPSSHDPKPVTMSRTEFDRSFPGEGDLIERKSGIGSDPLQEAVVAFSNASGGVILIGVDNSGEIIGRELTQGVEDALHQTLADVRDPGRYEISALLIDNKPITILSVARREEGFSQTSNARVLVRRGARNAALFGGDLQRFISERALSRFEATDTSIDAAKISEEAFARLRDAYEWSDPQADPERLQEQGLLCRSHAGQHLTVAGALYLLEEPHTADLGKAYIEILRYPEGANDYDRRDDITGTLNEQVARATDLIIDELGSEVVVLGLRRHELPRLPKVVLREALANAVAHRSYEQTGSAIRVELRPDAVRITSPGGLPEPVTVKNIRDAQAARNVNVINVLRRFRLAEDVGRGVDVMEDLMLEELLDPPVFNDTGHAVELTLPIRGAIAPVERAWLREVQERGLIEASDRLLLVHAARGEVLTNARVRELLAVDSVEARDALHRLRDADFLVQSGRRGGATYRLQTSLEPPAGLRLTDDELQRIVLEMASEGTITNSRVRARTGVDRTEALRILDSMVRDGSLARRGERRGTHYVVPEN